MLLDTDILISAQRGSDKAADFLDALNEKIISLQTYLELLQGVRNLVHQKATQEYILKSRFKILPFSENIGARALSYIEKYNLSHGLMAGDAIVAATAVENKLSLATQNLKRFRFIHGLKLEPFRWHRNS